MRLKYKCKECGTSIGFEGLCWQCRAKQHRKEVNNWSVEEIEEKKNQIINSIKSLGDEKFYSTDEFDLFGDLMTRGIDCTEIAKAACEYELYYPIAHFYKADEKVRDILIERIKATESSDDAICILG